MIKEAMQWIFDRKREPQRMDIEGQVFVTEQLVKIPEPTPARLPVHSLTAVVDYVKFNYDEQKPFLVHVESPTEVNIYSTYDRDMARKLYIESTALLPQINFGKFTPAELFNIAVQSCFVPNEDRTNVLAMAGNLRDEAVKTSVDDGVTQQVTVKDGTQVVITKPVPNPVNLKPFRTFAEIVQPESAFVLRVRKGDNGPECALFEADGGAWKIIAMQSIKDYLYKELDPEVSGGRVTIIA